MRNDDGSTVLGLEPLVGQQAAGPVSRIEPEELPINGWSVWPLKADGPAAS